MEKREYLLSMVKWLEDPLPWDTQILISMVDSTLVELVESPYLEGRCG
jgi:hypothetical protein